MASERYIDLQLIKPLTKGSGNKGKISLTNLLKEYFVKLNVGFLDPCCTEGSPGASNCPAISADPNNALQCRPDGLYTENDFVSVFDFGVIGDGITDDTVNIQTALESGASSLLFPQGNYLITNPLLLESNTTILGYGATLIRGSNMNTMMRNNADGITGGYGANENIKIFGLGFNGNAATFTSQCTLLALGHAKNIEIKDCEFYNIPIWHGVELNAVQNVTVHGCSLHNGNGEELLQLDLMGGPGQFPWFGPYDNTACNGIIVDNCQFYNATGTGGTQGGGLGSHSGGDPYQHTDVVWSNNVFRNIFNNAMKAHNYRNIVISGNVVDGCRNGITGSSDTNPSLTAANYTIVNNHISNATSFATDGQGILLFRLKNILISGNTFSNIRNSTIHIGACDKLIITNNAIENGSIDTVADRSLINLASPCNFITIANNILFKSSAGFVGGTNLITSVAGSANLIIENNVFSTPGTTTTFTNLLTNSAIVGANTINNKITPFISTKTTDYTYTPTDSVLNVDTTTGNITITVNPAIFNKAGLVVRKTTADVNTVIIVPTSGTINGAGSVTLTAQNQTAIITSDWINLDATITTT